MMKLYNKKSHLFMGFVCIILLTVVFVHTSPKLSVRAKLFSEFHFKESLSSKIESTTSPIYSDVYKVSPAPLDKSTNTVLDVYYVKKTLFVFYHAGYDSGI
ncbi:MAG TPA: hypothetical protein VGC17_00120 [Lactovum miscens]|uniref:hypothetical protein n=1 Tax=Lactovum miscens TaxID=190387 RepID=UPI002EDBAB14